MRSPFPTASLIGQSGSFALPVDMGGTGIALFLQATIDCDPSTGLEEPPSEQSLNLFT